MLHGCPLSLPGPHDTIDGADDSGFPFWKNIWGAPGAPPPAPLHRYRYGGAWGGLQLERWGGLGGPSLEKEGGPGGPQWKGVSEHGGYLW